MEDIKSDILKFASECEENLCYLKSSSRDKNIVIDKVRSNGGIEFHGNREGTVNPDIVDQYATLFEKGEAVHCDDDVSGGNTRAVAEGIVAHHPQVVFCKQPKTDGGQSVKHTKWLDHIIHKPGEIIRRDDLGTIQVGELETSDWTAPEWCLAAKAARQLEDDDLFNEDRLYDLLDQTTSRSEWEEKINLLRLIQSEETESWDGPTQEEERAQWYFDFSRGEYGDWNDYFVDASPEEGLAEKAIEPEADEDQRDELCDMLDLEASAVATTGFASSQTVGMFVEALQDAGMHVQAQEAEEADASS